jgi:hypothetical protein
MKDLAVISDGNTLLYKIDANYIDKVNNVDVAASSGLRYVDLVENANLFR